jgi:sulfate transport system permease protein
VASSQSTVVGTGNPLLKWALRVLVVGYLFLLVAWPSALIVRRAFEGGVDAFTTALQDPDVVHAIKLSVTVALISVVINLLFGVGMSLLLVRYEFPGKRVLSALIDLPLAVSPIVVGLALILVYNGRYGWFGPTLEDNGLQVVFAMPGMIMATTFVALPLVIREVVPVLEDMGDDQEQAANSLGANAWQTFWRITLPGIKWAVVYGVVLSLARSLGEFGAVKVVAGNVSGETTTAPVLVQQKYQNFEQQTAYAVSFVLVAVAIVCLVIVALLRPKDHKPSRATATAAIQENS